MSTIKLLSGGAGGRGRSFAGLFAADNLNILWKKADNDTARAYGKLAMSRSGQYQCCCLTSGTIYYSSDYGVLWAASDAPVHTWTEICCNTAGTIFYACANTGGIFKSINSGVNWLLAYAGPVVDWRGVACSSSGQYVLATAGPAYANQWVSSNYGAAFAAVGPASGGFVTHPAVAGSGQIMYICRGGTNYKSVDFGATWDAGILIEAAGCDRVRCDSSGNRLLFYIIGRALWYSNNAGVSFKKHGWTCLAGSGAVPGGDIAISSDGKFQGLVCNSDVNATAFLYLSNNYGNSWKCIAPVQSSIGLDFSDDFKYLTRSTLSVNAMGCSYLYYRV